MTPEAPIRFVLNGTAIELTAQDVQRALQAAVPEPVREHGVRIDGVIYPVKQAFEAASGIPRQDFTSQTARRHLARLGFEVVGGETREPRAAGTSQPAFVQVTPEVSVAQAWPWEGQVQDVFANFLSATGWTVTGMADTATKAHGVDVLAQKGERVLGAEVKGWPSKGYADPRRAHETKRTQPTTQAGHWFSQALVKAIMLLDTHPGHESLVVLPDYPRYRDLAGRTATGRRAAGIHVVLVQASGEAASDTWSP